MSSLLKNMTPSGKVVFIIGAIMSLCIVGTIVLVAGVSIFSPPSLKVRSDKNIAATAKTPDITIALECWKIGTVKLNGVALDNAAKNAVCSSEGKVYSLNDGNNTFTFVGTYKKDGEEKSIETKVVVAFDKKAYDEEQARIKAEAEKTPIPTETQTPSATATVLPTTMAVSPTVTQAPTVSTPTPTPNPTNPVINFKGSGRKTTSKFTLNSGLSIFTFSNNGDSNFIVQIKDIETAEVVDYLVNEIGKGTFQVPFQAESGTKYVLSINSNGSWTGKVEQPIYTKPSYVIPKTFSDKGSRVKAVYLLAGAYHVKGSHKGNANFIVRLFDIDGDYDLWVNAIGKYSFDDYVQIPRAGVYFLSVKADGSWTFTFEET